MVNRKLVDYDNETKRKISKAFYAMVDIVDELDEEIALGVVKAVASYTLNKNNTYCSYGQAPNGSCIVVTGPLAEYVKEYVDSIDHEGIANSAILEEDQIQ